MLIAGIIVGAFALFSFLLAFRANTRYRQMKKTRVTAIKGFSSESYRQGRKFWAFAGLLLALVAAGLIVVPGLL